MKRILCKHIDFCFKIGDVEFILVDRYWAQSRTKNRNNIIYLKFSEKFVKYLLKNYYLEIGNKIRQITGIPMGFGLPPFSTNLFLFYYGSNWTKKMKK